MNLARKAEAELKKFVREIEFQARLERMERGG